ncbi:hypothetical protein RHSIM_Rhsim12G0097200 [Rhododendron simsii]|uniref:Uncharacterized protein n=1 Tax=Rhododendron simsii TaxID=118357 RepID=A0A834G2T5_RHOSS|nr:hypothetical protein RHSIM_Rhsim12G0097200 [Rhododendron simsii]
MSTLDDADKGWKSKRKDSESSIKRYGNQHLISFSCYKYGDLETGIGKDVRYE